MKYCGAPDLPFLATVGWYFKQIGATFIVVGCFAAVIGGIYAFILWRAK